MKNKTWAILLLISLLTGGVFSFAASASPDGLERVAEDKGFVGSAMSYLSGLLPDYKVPGISNDTIATGLAGCIGTGFVFFVLYGLGYLITKRATDKKYLSR